LKKIEEEKTFLLQEQVFDKQQLTLSHESMIQEYKNKLAR
jgi:hypothetical protein